MFPISNSSGIALALNIRTREQKKESKSSAPSAGSGEEEKPTAPYVGLHSQSISQRWWRVRSEPGIATSQLSNDQVRKGLYRELEHVKRSDPANKPNTSTLIVGSSGNGDSI